MHIIRRDWATLGPKLQGKLHIYVGEMDNYCLPNAISRLRHIQMFGPRMVQRIMANHPAGVDLPSRRPGSAIPSGLPERSYTGGGQSCTMVSVPDSSSITAPARSS